MEKPMTFKFYQIKKIVESRKMRKQTFNKIKKTLAILLAVCFLASVTAASVSAASAKDVKSDLKKNVVSKNADCTKNVKSELKKNVVSKSAGCAKNAKSELKKKVVGNKDCSELTEKQKTEEGNKLLDYVDNNWFRTGAVNNWGRGLVNYRGNGLFNGGCNNCDNDWGDDWGDDWEDD